MKLSKALELRHQIAASTADPFRVWLACGLTPLHLETFLIAWLKTLSPASAVAVQAGLFGDCAGNLEAATTKEIEATALVLEWSDLDPRLGLRQLSGWRPADLPDILSTVLKNGRRLEQAVCALAERMPVVASMPTLPVPPLALTPGWQDSEFTLALREAISSLALRLGARPRVRIISSQRLDLCSPPGERHDVRMDLIGGFPYHLKHTDTLAEMLARQLLPAPPKKALVTDLDNTLWAGIVGDLGPQNVSWDSRQQAQAHGLYQQMLNSLSEAGVLIAVASKNDTETVDAVLDRDDLLIPRDRLFPVEAGWGRKSEAIDRILRVWNISSESVVFVDDSPMELAEVRSAFPAMECLQYPPGDAQVYALLERLRDLFGKSALFEEDSMRLDSIRRSAAVLDEPRSDVSSEAFLQGMGATLLLAVQRDPSDARALELVNKTNQFNLNGKRLSERSWTKYLQRPDAILLTATYDDKFGPLGKVVALAGRLMNSRLAIDTWVMSCRAFSRRIEYGCLKTLFDHFQLDEIVFDYESTPKNGPMREFLQGLLDGPPAPGASLQRSRFTQNCPSLFHAVKVVSDE